MRSYIKLPIKVLTQKIPGKQNSVFYAGHNIAEIKVQDRTYVLTTAGEYSFKLKEDGERIYFDSCQKIGTGGPGGGTTRYKAVSKLTDRKIKTLNDNDLVSEWGWFGINIWVNPTGVKGCEVGLVYPVDAYTQYDEAMKAFIDFVEGDLQNA